MVSTGSDRGLGIVFLELKIGKQGANTESKAEIRSLALQAGVHDNRATGEILLIQMLVK